LGDPWAYPNAIGGRDRFWGLSGLNLNDDQAWEANKDVVLLDAVKTTIIRNNRWRCDHGWDIDLDDGSSSYHIYNNLLLHGGLKNREGFYRVYDENLTCIVRYDCAGVDADGVRGN
jgi:hypothetical protein